MDKILIHNARIVDPAQGLDRTGSLLVGDGKITLVGPEIPAGFEGDIFEAGGLVACPGFIDLHCHLRQPGFEASETIATGTRAAARGGFTTVCCMPNTDPPLDTPATLAQVLSIASREALVRVLPIACVSMGRAGQAMVDMRALSRAGAIGFSDDGSPVMDSLLMRRALERSRELGLPIIDHCEDAGLARGGQINEGAVSAKLGLQGMPAAAEEIMVARDLILAELTGGRLHLAHVSTTGSVELVRRAREKGLRFTVEVTPHHLTLTEAAAAGGNTSAKVNPPLRTPHDVAALIQGLKDGTIDIIATDHAPHAEADKRCDFTRAAFGISGFETALGSLMGLVHSGQLSLTTLIAALTVRPAAIIGERYGRLGTLAAGADLTIFDPDREWVVDPAAFASKGRNTPLAGVKLKGKVMATIAQGKLVFKDEAVKIEKAKALKVG